MIIDKVQTMLTTATQDKSANLPLLKMLAAQLKIAEHSRKSGEGITDDKATVIINRMIEGIKRDAELSGTDVSITEQKVQLLKSLL